MIARAALRKAVDVLERAGCESARLDADILLQNCWGKSASGLMAALDEALPPNVEHCFLRALERRSKREPTAYILGEKEFWSRSFRVTPDVLIPRPETEHVVEAVCANFQDIRAPWSFCDIGTGSGCIAVTLACEYPHARLVATDISPPALAIAHSNALRHSVSARVVFRGGDMFTALQATDGPFDAIVSNPPYVSSDDMNRLAPELSFEPREALTDEADGRRHLERLVAGAADWLKPQGLLIVETGVVGLPRVSSDLMHVRTVRDLAGHERVGVYRLLRSPERPACVGALKHQT